MGRLKFLKSKRKVLAEGFRDGIPIGLGYLAVSFSSKFLSKFIL